jgi:hypothetical protein
MSSSDGIGGRMDGFSSLETYRNHGDVDGGCDTDAGTNFYLAFNTRLEPTLD